MLSLIFILIVVAIGLTAVLWAGSFFFQGYIYTQPSAGIFWQAPAVGIFLTIGFTIWCFSIAFSTRASTTNLPINTIFRFSPVEDMVDRPIPKIWAIKRKKAGENQDGERTAYESRRGDRGNYYYADTSLARRRWQSQDIIAIETENSDGTKMRFDIVPTDYGQYRHFVSRDGWTIIEFEEGPTGLPTKFHLSLLIWNILFNVAHFLAWFVGLWLVLRYQWLHALGLGSVLWLIVTLTVLPMILGYAGQVAESRRTRTAMESTLEMRQTLM